MPAQRQQPQLPTSRQVAMLSFLLYLIAFVCFVLVALGIGPARLNLLGVGLASWVLVPLIHAWPS